MGSMISVSRWSTRTKSPPMNERMPRPVNAALNAPRRSRWQLRRIASAIVVSLLAGVVKLSFAASPQAQLVISGLQEPNAIAIRPDAGAPYEVYVADRAAAQIVKFETGKRDSSTSAITDFPSAGSGASRNKSDDGISA